MTLMHWEPLREIEDVLGRYGRAMGFPLNRAQVPFTDGEWAPRVDISEKDGHYTIRAEIPGVKREDLKVSVQKGVLTLRGDRHREQEEHGRQYHRIERSYGSFVRSFSLPERVDVSHLEARFHDGLLDIDLPCTQEPETPAIEVQVG
jgi:HSP20 family protein